MGDIIETVSGLLVTPEKPSASCDTVGDHLVRTECDAGVSVSHIQIAGAEVDCNAKPRR